MEATTAVIKVDRVSQGKKTSLQDILEIAVNTTLALRRCTQYINSSSSSCNTEVS
jgi:hypothetical protein